MDPAKVKALIDALTANPPDPEAIKAAAADMLAALAGAGDVASVPPPADDGALADPSAPPADPKPAPPGSALARLTGAATEAEAISRYTAMQVQVATLTADRDAAELSAKQRLVGELVKLGAETPATAWLNADKRIPAKRFAAESVTELEARVESLRASRPVIRGHEPPTGEGSDLDAEVERLSKTEIAECKKRGLDLKEYVVAKIAAVRRA